ncbi:hypothetical protein BQ8482_800014 [Mesorhizobium delmotii]|uniref:Uncharacterized protein n=1 Tax=Mesorhizobium delmotii TaxID=1631247 RepID=A0A2P9AWN9_9HYPH|nr:hypothetical protein BQ8482_800014 [Mesorhizobium delmotii]
MESCPWQGSGAIIGPRPGFRTPFGCQPRFELLAGDLTAD